MFRISLLDRHTLDPQTAYPNSHVLPPFTSNIHTLLCHIGLRPAGSLFRIVKDIRRRNRIRTCLYRLDQAFPLEHAACAKIIYCLGNAPGIKTSSNATIAFGSDTNAFWHFRAIRAFTTDFRFPTPQWISATPRALIGGFCIVCFKLMVRLHHAHIRLGDKVRRNESPTNSPQD